MKKHMLNHPRAASFTAAVLGLSLLTAATVQAQDGTWISLTNGSWADSANWTGAVIADGANNTADFSTLDLTNDTTVTLDGARTIGSVVFDDTTADTNGYSALQIDTGSAGPLTFDGTSPSVSGTNGIGVIGAVVAGANGLTKTGPGIVVFSNNANTFSNNVATSPGLVVSEGILATVGYNANGSVLGAVGSITTNRENQKVVLDGATLAIDVETRFANGAIFQIAGDGVGGTNGAIYCDVTGGGNRTRFNSRIGETGPQIDLATNATIRVDGTPLVSDQMIVDGFALNGHTLSKTGDGTLFISSQSGADNSGAGHIHLKEGQIGTRQNSFSYGRDVTVDAGAFIAPVSSGAFPAGNRSLTNNGLVSLNSRGSAGNMTQTFSMLYGSGTITAGENMGAYNNNFLVLGGNFSTNDSFYSGTITNPAIVSLHVTKNATNMATLSGNNTYNGVTTVNAGTLAVDGAHTGTGGYLVDAGATLSGSGTISSTVTNEGTVASSAGGTLTILEDILSTFGYSGDINIADSTLSVGGKIGNAGAFQPIATLTLSNGTLVLPLDLAGASASVSTLNVDAASVLEFTTASPATGQFPLISYLSLGGAVGFSGLSLVSPPGVTASLVDSGTSVDVLITAVPALTWNGNVNGDWDIGITANWQGPTVWSEPNGATFDDTASGVTAVNVTTTVSPDAVVLNNSSLAYSFSGAGDITGTAGLVKNGSGTLTVANNNTFSGGVALNAGTLRVGSAGTSGSLGTGNLNNSATLVLDRTDDFTLGNTVSGTGAWTKEGTGTATVPVGGSLSGAVTVNAGTLALAPSGEITISGTVTGSGAFGMTGSGTAILSGFGNAWSGGTVISNGTLRVGDEFGSGSFPGGNVVNDGTLTIAQFVALPNNISGSGGVSVISNQTVTLSGANTYTGPTFVEGTLTAGAGSYPVGSALVLGNVEAGITPGTANFTGFNPVLGGLTSGSSDFTGGSVHLGAGSSSLAVNGDVLVGVTQPNGASVAFTVADDEVSGTKSMSVVKDGGIIQLGYNNYSGGGNVPDSVLVDLSQLGTFYANLGETGLVNLGTLNSGNPPGGFWAINELRLASVSNLLSVGTIAIGAGANGTEGQLTLGAGTNILNADIINIGSQNRDWGSLFFQPAAVGSGSLQIRGFGGGTNRATLGIGDVSSGTGAVSTNKFDVAGNYADLLLDQLIIGDEPQRNGVWGNTFSFDQGVLDALSVSISARDDGGAHGTDAASSTVNLGGGTVTFGPVVLVGDTAAGTLNVTGGTLTAASITDSGAGTSTFNLSAPTFNLDLVGFGNPATAPVVVDNFNPSGAVTVNVNAAGLAVGQFELISYGTMGGTGFGALTLGTLPASVVGSLSNNVANSSVDLVITSAPVVINPNPTTIVYSVSGDLLSLGWPVGHTGWELQSNSVSLTATSSWFVVPGSTATNLVTLPVNAVETNVFFRMFLP